MSEIWGYGKNEKKINECKVYTENPLAKEEIKRMEGCRPSNTYYSNGLVAGWDIIFPARIRNGVERVLEHFSNA